MTTGVPPQVEGNALDIVERKECNGIEEAETLFNDAKQRLLNVNEWEEICDGISASFTVTDNNGEAIQGLPEPGDYIQIDIPGPSLKSGRGYDWVQVELIESNGDASSPNESVIMRVRPSHHPQDTTGTAHFFDSSATSSFIVRRNNCIVEAAILGRNEKPNKENDNLGDAVRNAVTGVIAAAGFSAIQWRKLAKALINA
jgi:hypothetical protein